MQIAFAAVCATQVGRAVHVRKVRTTARALSQSDVKGCYTCLFLVMPMICMPSRCFSVRLGTLAAALCPYGDNPVTTNQQQKAFRILVTYSSASLVSSHPIVVRFAGRDSTELFLVRMCALCAAVSPNRVFTFNCSVIPDVRAL
ncbi:MAG: hypothetical protein EOO65_01380 [Methanosarcinales archaeon]|nr:MAG: hypothetical protein EOO65_01380 [Methanosarcinales archaeon]